MAIWRDYMCERLTGWILGHAAGRVSRLDVLSDVLSRAHARGALFGRWLLSSPLGPGL
jgi:hypothetical protein